MADIRWLGQATAVAKVMTATPANVEVGDIFTLTATGIDGDTNSVSFTATATAVANVTDGLTTAWNASTHDLMTAITAADVGSTHISLTADTAGVGFTVTSSAVNGGAADTQTLTMATTTANAGPADWSTAANWSGGAVPGGGAGQDVYLDNFSGDILYGLDQSGIANALDSLNIGQTFTGKLGPNGIAGDAGDYLQIKATALNVGSYNGPGSPGGSGRLKVDLGATESTVTVDNTGSATDSGKPTLRLLANNAATVVRVRKGSVGIAYEAGETTTIASVDESYISSQSTDADVYIGEGVTVTTITKTGGDMYLGCAATTVTNESGNLTTYGSGAITTLNTSGGTVTANSGERITTLNATGGHTDFTKSVAARTVTTPKIGSGGQVSWDPAYVTFTNEIAPYSASGQISLTAA